MKLSETRYDDAETGCCARVDRSVWDEKSFDWRDKPFLEDHVRALMHVPIGFGSVISRDLEAVEHAGAYPEQPFWLVDEVSPWGSTVYVAVDRDVPGATMTTLSGQFMSKVFEGPYRDVGKWIRSMEEYVAASGRTIEQLYFYYATCPRCAKRFGKNEVVLFAKVGGGGSLPS